MIDPAPRRRHLLQLAFALPIAAAIAHLIATFLAASSAQGSAFTRLQSSLKTNVMTLLDPVRPGSQPLPFLSPDARYAMCLFTTAGGPVRIEAVLPDEGWTLGVFRPDGSSAYFAAAAPGRESAISLTLTPDDDRFLGMTPQALGQSIDVAPKLTVAAKDGVVVIRAPDSGTASEATAAQYLAKASCAAVSY